MTPILHELGPRQQLAGLVRILARHSYDDKLAGHVSVADRDDGTLLVNPLGRFWSRVSARDFPDAPPSLHRRRDRPSFASRKDREGTG